MLIFRVLIVFVLIVYVLFVCVLTVCVLIVCNAQDVANEVLPVMPCSGWEGDTARTEL